MLYKLALTTEGAVAAYRLLATPTSVTPLM